MFSYHRLRVGSGAETEIAGASDSIYTLCPADVDGRVKVRVCFRDDNGSPESVLTDAQPSSGFIQLARCDNQANKIIKLDSTGEIPQPEESQFWRFNL